MAELAEATVGTSRSVIATAETFTEDDQVYTVSVENRGTGTVTLGDVTVTATSGRTVVAPGQRAKVTLTSGEALYGIADAGSAVLSLHGGVSDATTPLDVAGGGGAVLFAWERNFGTVTDDSGGDSGLFLAMMDTHYRGTNMRNADGAIHPGQTGIYLVNVDTRYGTPPDPRPGLDCYPESGYGGSTAIIERTDGDFSQFFAFLTDAADRIFIGWDSDPGDGNVSSVDVQIVRMGDIA